MNQTKIYINCEKDCIYPQDNILLPIQVGSANSKELLPMQSDNIGENISDKYFCYKSLTSQYWAWKNIQSDYIGFMNANKYFNFNASTSKKAKDNYKSGGGVTYKQYLYLKDFEKYGIHATCIQEKIQGFDLILPQITQKEKNLKDEYSNSWSRYQRDLDFCLSFIEKEYPIIYPYALKYLNQKQVYFNDIFIMKSNYFHAYMEFLFSILDEHEKIMDCSNYSVEAISVSYHLSEYLGGIFFYYLLHSNKSIQLKRLHVIQFINIEKDIELTPAFTENNISIFMATNEHYLPYAATTIQSIIEHSSSENNYDIIILSKDITPENQADVKRAIKKYNNFQIRFYNMAKFVQQYPDFYTYGYFSVEAYFRLFMPWVLKSYHKMLYLDCDLIVKKDVAELYNIDMKDNLLIAVRDVVQVGRYNGYEKTFVKNYFDNILKLKNPYDYFNSGVLVMNMDGFRTQLKLDSIIEISHQYKYPWLDQDILNMIANEKTIIVEFAWNVVRGSYDGNKTIIPDIVNMPIELYDDFLKGHNNPYIIHYAGGLKPWQTPYSPFASDFWYYARKTFFYEKMFYREIERVKHDAIALTKPKKKFKRAIKKMLMPFVNLFFPKGSRRREKLKRLLRK